MKNLSPHALNNISVVAKQPVQNNTIACRNEPVSVPTTSKNDAKALDDSLEGY